MGAAPLAIFGAVDCWRGGRVRHWRELRRGDAGARLNRDLRDRWKADGGIRRRDRGRSSSPLEQHVGRGGGRFDGIRRRDG